MEKEVQEGKVQNKAVTTHDLKETTLSTKSGTIFSFPPDYRPLMSFHL